MAGFIERWRHSGSHEGAFLLVVDAALDNGYSGRNRIRRAPAPHKTIALAGDGRHGNQCCSATRQKRAFLARLQV